MKDKFYEFVYRVRELALPVLGAFAITALVYFSKNGSSSGESYVPENSSVNSTSIVSNLERSLNE